MNSANPRRASPGEFFYRAAGAAFIAVSAVSLASMLFSGEGAFRSLAAAVALAVTALYAGVYTALSRARITPRRFAAWVAAASVLFLSAGLSFARYLAFTPSWDLEAVYRGAELMATGGDFTAYSSEHCLRDYFYIYPNNFGAMLLLSLWFKALSIFGVRDFYTAAVTLNLLTVTATMLVSCYAARRLYGDAAGLSVSVMFLCSPLLFSGPVFYTDTLSMCFPAAAFALFLSARDAPARRALPLCAAGALLLAAGGAVKAGALVLIPAAAIELFVRGKWRRAVPFLAVTLSAALAVNFAVGAVRERYLDSGKLACERMPASYWLALGLSGEGGYDNEIFSAARSIRDPAARDAAMWRRVREGVAGNGPSGTAALLFRKAGRTLGDGTYGLGDFLDDSPLRETGPHRFLLPGSSGYPLYSGVAGGFLLAALLLSLFSLRRSRDSAETLTPQLFLLGITLLYMVWENNGRAAPGIVPLLFVAASGGLANIGRKLAARG